MANITDFRTRSINLDLWTEHNENLSKNSPMRNFYRGKTIFLTGGTGFLGQLWVEKLLRCEVKCLYLLSRPKRGQAPIDRMRVIFSGNVFKSLAAKDPNYIDRIRVIDGNTRQLNVGLSPDDRQAIINNVDIIIHAAADVRFDLPLKELTLVNLRGTRELLKIAEQMKKLQLFTYISTAYSHCERKHIEEKYYECPIEPNQLISLAEDVDGDATKEYMLEVLTEMFILPWPNTYSFTKAVSEEMVRSYATKLPIVVVRPTIVISTHEDPIPGWCNNVYGLNGMLVATALGFLRLMLFDPAIRAEIVCADFVTNSTLAAIWDRLTTMSAQKRALTQEEPKIYTIAADDNELTWGRVSSEMCYQLEEYPANQSMWIPTPSTTKYRFLEFFYVMMYHAIPGVLFDIYLKITKNPRRLLPLYRKCLMFMVKLRYFMAQEWTFDKKNICDVYDRMDDMDQKFFPCDIRKFSWAEFRINYYLGLVHYVGQEELNNFDAARVKYGKMEMAHRFVVIFYYVFLISLYYYFGKIIGINDYLLNVYLSLKMAIGFGNAS